MSSKEDGRHSFHICAAAATRNGLSLVLSLALSLPALVPNGFSIPVYGEGRERIAVEKVPICGSSDIIIIQ
jgi:hypothetical protein